MRHSCEQEDKLANYNWIVHDGRTAGVQHIVDAENNVKLAIELLKTPGGEEGGSWAARISGEPVDTCSLRRLSAGHVALADTDYVHTFLQLDRLA